jgi:hypothetical protein
MSTPHKSAPRLLTVEEVKHIRLALRKSLLGRSFPPLARTKLALLAPHAHDLS